MRSHTLPELFYKTLVPLFEQQKMPFIAISTPDGSSNFYSVLCRKKDEAGNPFFNVIEVEFFCADCKATGDEKIMSRCRHRDYLKPEWKAADKADRVSNMYEGQESVQLRENQGVIADSEQNRYKSALLDRFFTLEPFKSKYSPRVIYLSCDPSGGGDSEMAFSAMADYKNTNNDSLVLIMLATCLNKGGSLEQNTIVKSVIGEIRRRPLYQNIPIVMMIEAAPASEGTNVAMHVQHVSRLKVMSEADSGRKYGVPKTNLNTAQQHIVFESLLVSNRLKVAEDLIIISKDAKPTIGGIEYHSEKKFMLAKSKLSSAHLDLWKLRNTSRKVSSRHID